MCLRALYRIKSCICSVTQAGIIGIVMTDIALCTRIVQLIFTFLQRVGQRPEPELAEVKENFSQSWNFVSSPLYCLILIYLFMYLFLILGSVRRKSNFNLFIQKANSRVSFLD